MEREACVCDHGFERSDLCAEIIIIIILLYTYTNRHVGTLSLFRKNLNASKPCQLVKRLGLGGNIGCRDKNSTLHGIKRVPQWSHIGSTAYVH